MLIANCPDVRGLDQAILVLCLDAGLRRGEIASLQVRDLDPLTSVLTVGEGSRPPTRPSLIDVTGGSARPADGESGMSGVEAFQGTSGHVRRDGE